MTSSDIQTKISGLILERHELYKSVQDMTVSSNKTDEVIKKMQSITTQINGLTKKYKDAKKEESAADFLKQKKEFLNK